MILLERLYRLLAADDQTRLLDPFSTRQVATAALAFLTTAVTHPGGPRHVILVTHIFARAVPGLGQNVTNSGLRLYFRSSVTAQERDLAFVGAGAADVRQAITYAGELLWFDGFTIQADGSFNAAAVANSVEVTVLGVKIPLGNVERLL